MTRKTATTEIREFVAFARMYPDTFFSCLLLTVTGVFLAATFFSGNDIGRFGIALLTIIPLGVTLLVARVLQARKTMESEFADEIIDSLILGDLDPDSPNPYRGSNHPIEHNNLDNPFDF